MKLEQRILKQLLKWHKEIHKKEATDWEIYRYCTVIQTIKCIIIEKAMTSKT